MSTTTKSTKLFTSLLNHEADAADFLHRFADDADGTANATVFGPPAEAAWLGAASDVSMHFANAAAAFAKPPLANAVYQLTPTASAINEGATAIFNLKTSKVADGTVLAYTLSGTGITAGDFANGLSGSVTVFGGKASIRLAAVNDKATEGAEVVTITLFNKSAVVATSAITINDTSINHAPTFASSKVTANVMENTTAVYTALASDADGNALTYTLAGTDAALFTISATSGAVSFKNAPNYEVDKHSYNFDVVATDSATPALSSTQQATVSVTNVNEAPSAMADTPTATVGADSANGNTYRIKLSDLLANDVDPDTGGNTGLGVASVAALPFNGNGAPAIIGDEVVFEATPGRQTGYFTYTVSDAGGLTSSAVVTVNLNPAPVMSPNQTLAVTEAQSGATSASGNAIATDVEGGVTYSLSGINGGASKGTVVITDASTGAYVYTYTGVDGAAAGALPGGTGDSDSISFIATSSQGHASAPAAIAVTVTGVDNAPVNLPVQPAALTVASGSSYTIDLSNYAHDPDSAPIWSLSSASTSKGGAITLTANGIATVSYAQGGGSAALGADSFGFGIADASGAIAFGTVSALVANTAPSAANISSANAPGLADLPSGQTAIIDVLGLGGADADGNALTAGVVPASFSAGGSGEIRGGLLYYTPAAEYAGEETFGYTVADGFGGMATATVTVTVAPDSSGGTAGNDLIFGSSSAEVINALGGNDTVYGGGGADTISGGSGDDSIAVSANWSADPLHTTPVYINGGSGFDTILVRDAAVNSLGDLAFAHISNIESVALATDSDGQTLALGSAAVAAGVLEVTAAKLSGANHAIIDLSGMFGSAGVSVIGGAGGDVILGTGGNDTISGGGALGNDVIAGGAGADRIALSPTATSEQIVRINLNADVASGTNLADADIYTGFTVGKHFIDLSGAMLQSSGGMILALTTAMVTSSAATLAGTNDGFFSMDNFGATMPGRFLSSASASDFSNFGAIANQSAMVFDLTSDIVTGEQAGASNSLLNQAGVDEAVAYIVGNFATSTVANVSVLLLVSDGANQAMFRYQEGGLDQGIQASELTLIGVFDGGIGGVGIAAEGII